MADHKIGVIVEGAAEKAVFNILLESNNLLFTKEDLLIGNPTHTRAAKKYCERNLKMIDNVEIIRILDSETEKFNILKSYQRKVSKIINVYTKPEIEMLVIHSENLYEQYIKSRKKPSTFLVELDKQYKFCKSQDFIRMHFSDPEKLVRAITEYERTTQKKNCGFTQILKK